MNISVIGSFPSSKYSSSSRLSIEIKQRLSRYLASIIKANREECFHFLCRCDNEFGKMACMVILELEEHFLDCEITLEVALPFEIKDNNFNENEKFRYNNYLYLADKITVVDTLDKYRIPFTLAGVYSEKKIYNCNKYLVDNGNLIVFYSSEFYGEVRDSLNYARKLNRHYVNIHKGVNYGYRKYKCGSI